MNKKYNTSKEFFDEIRNLSIPGTVLSNKTKSFIVLEQFTLMDDYVSKFSNKDLRRLSAKAYSISDNLVATLIVICFEQNQEIRDCYLHFTGNNIIKGFMPEEQKIIKAVY